MGQSPDGAIITAELIIHYYKGSGASSSLGESSSGQSATALPDSMKVMKDLDALKLLIPGCTPMLSDTQWKNGQARLRWELVKGGAQYKWLRYLVRYANDNLQGVMNERDIESVQWKEDYIIPIHTLPETQPPPLPKLMKRAQVVTPKLVASHKEDVHHNIWADMSKAKELHYVATRESDALSGSSLSKQSPVLSASASATSRSQHSGPLMASRKRSALDTSNSDISPQRRVKLCRNRYRYDQPALSSLARSPSLKGAVSSSSKAIGKAPVSPPPISDLSMENAVLRAKLQAASAQLKELRVKNEDVAASRDQALDDLNNERSAHVSARKGLAIVRQNESRLQSDLQIAQKKGEDAAKEITRLSSLLERKRDDYEKLQMDLKGESQNSSRLRYDLEVSQLREEQAMSTLVALREDLKAAEQSRALLEQDLSTALSSACPPSAREQGAEKLHLSLREQGDLGLDNTFDRVDGQRVAATIVPAVFEVISFLGDLTDRVLEDK